MEQAIGRTIAILTERGAEMPFADLIRAVAADTHLDEASIKAAVLRLNSDRLVEITPDWNVSLPRPVEADSQAA